jgi:hypothetical protein
MIVLAQSEMEEARHYLQRALIINPTFSLLEAPIAKQSFATLDAEDDR